MRKQALLGCLYCVLLLSGYLYLDTTIGGVVCATCAVIWPLFIAYTGLLFMAAIQHPRKFGSKVYAIILFIVATTALFISAARLLFQHGINTPLPVCEPSQWAEFSALPYLEKLLTLLFNNSMQCQGQLLSQGITATQIIALAATSLFIFSLYLLLRKVDRNIFS